MIYLANDHNGVETMKYVVEWLTKHELDYVWIGAETFDKSDSYVTYIKKANELVKKEGNMGVYMCGTGLGASIAANRLKGIRAALCYSPEMAYYARFHNNSNVLVLSGGYNGKPKVKVTKRNLNKILKMFFTTQFEGERHIKRIKDLDEMY